MKLPVMILLLAAVNGALAQDTSSVFVDIAPCMNLVVSAERHACYDRLEASVRDVRQRAVPSSATTTFPAPLPAHVVEQPAADTAPVPAPSVETFGNQTPALGKVVANEAGEQELHDTITGLHEREPDRWLITLASGQVWYQTNSSRTRLREGMAVRIFPSPLGGSWRLAGAEGNTTGFIQVKRVE